MPLDFNFKFRLGKKSDQENSKLIHQAEFNKNIK